MTEETKYFLRGLKDVISKEELIKLILLKHSNQKGVLSRFGIKTNDENDEYPEEVTAGQMIAGKHLIDKEFYRELLYLKYGLTKQWYSVFDEERFSEIRSEVENIIMKIETK